MNADLMSSAGFYLHVEQRKFFESLSDFPNRKRVASGFDDAHTRSVPAVAPDFFADFSAFAFNDAVNQRDVRFINLSISELRGKRFVRCFVFCHDN